jgi:hypothetical protein
MTDHPLGRRVLEEAISAKALASTQRERMHLRCQPLRRGQTVRMFCVDHPDTLTSRNSLADTYPGSGPGGLKLCMLRRRAERGSEEQISWPAADGCGLRLAGGYTVSAWMVISIASAP